MTQTADLNPQPGEFDTTSGPIGDMGSGRSAGASTAKFRKRGLVRGTSRLSAVIQVATILLPWALRRRLMVMLFGYEIDRTARIGRSLVLADVVLMQKKSLIKNLTVIKGLSELVLDESGRIGNLNWISGFPANHPVFFKEETDRVSSLIVREHASITNRHLFDCNNRITIGKFTTVAGFRSQFLTHGIEIDRCRQTTKPIEIGAYCFVGTGSIILKGAIMPSYSVLGAGSMLRGKFYDEYKLLSGNPAQPVRDLNPADLYFHRLQGGVH